MRFETIGAIAIPARPRFGAVRIAAAAPRVRVLHFGEHEVLLPVRTFFRERCRAVAHLDPLHASIVELTCVRHIADVLVPRDRSAAERAIVDRPFEQLSASTPDPSRNEVPHYLIVRLP